MEAVLEARREFDQAREQARDLVARKRALLGRAMVRARESGAASQTKIAAAMEIGTKQVGTYEQAYRDWLRDHPGQSLD